jgi:perosamine synthetase
MKKNKSFVPVNRPLVGKEELANVKKCIESGWISSSGSYIKKFEKDFSKIVNRKYGIAVSSGTGAIDIAIKVLNLKKNDEIIVPNFTIISSVIEIIKQGLRPIFIDSKIDDFNIDTELLERKINKKTKAIMVVHIYGLPSNMEKILKISKKYNLRIIEDCAEQLGQKFKKKEIGSFGDISTFSFFANKHITTGEGGMVVTNNSKYYERCLKLRNICFEPKKPRFIHYDLGWNYRMTNIQASIGCAQLKKLNQFIKKKRLIGEFYNKKLKNLKNINLPKKKNKFSKNIYWVYPITLNNKIKAKDLSKKLIKLGIETRPFFYPMHMQPIIKKLKLVKKNEKFPVSEKLYTTGLYLPSGIGNTFKELNKVVKVLKTILK